MIGHRNLLDERNLLIAHFFRLVAELRPKAFVLENVPGILDERFANTLELALQAVQTAYRRHPASSTRSSGSGRSDS